VITLFALTIAAYVLGSIPSAVWVGRAVRGIDVREHGSGNMGATNVARVIGVPWALFVAVIDIAKGFAPVFWLGPIAGQAVGLLPDDARLILGAAAIIGHLYPAFAGFKGGKGVLTAAGVFLAIMPIEIGLAITLWGAVFAITRIVSVGSLVAAAGLVAIVFLRRFVWGAPIANSTLAATVIMVALVFYTHRANLRRILNGSEAKMGSSGNSNSRMTPRE